jgi:hypothetical protein
MFSVSNAANENVQDARDGLPPGTSGLICMRCARMWPSWRSRSPIPSPPKASASGPGARDRDEALSDAVAWDAKLSMRCARWART